MPPASQPIRYSDKEKANIMRISGQRMPKPCNASGRLAEIVLKACAYNPSERYESAGIMRQALEEILYSDSERKLIYPAGDTLENKKQIIFWMKLIKVYRTRSKRSQKNH